MAGVVRMSTVPGAVSGMFLVPAMPSVMPAGSHMAIRYGLVAGMAHMGIMLGAVTSAVLVPAMPSVMSAVSRVAVR